MSEQQVVFQYLSAGSNTLTVPAGFSNQVLVYAWGAGGGAGYAGGGSGDTYQRTVKRRSPIVYSFDVIYRGPGGVLSTSTETITVDPGVIPPPGPAGDPAPGSITYGDWIKISSGSPDSRAFGGGGGFVQGILTVNSGDTMTIAVGSRGGQGPRDGSGIGGTNSNPVLSFNGGTTGVAAGKAGDDNNYGAGGGGGAATAVFVNNVPMMVAAGGGGGGGGKSYQTGTAGSAGGVATQTAATQRGGASSDAYSVGGGGGGGYPLGGAGGLSVGDDAGASTGGYGGQNYANALVTSSTLTAGSGITPGGVTNTLYPRASRGYAGYDGAVIVIFTKSFRAWIKDTTWKEATNAWFKIPSSSTTLYRTIPPTTTTFTNSGAGTFVVPPGVTSVTLTMIGGGGSGQGNYRSPQGWPSPGGGSGAYFSGVSVPVTPGASIPYSVGGRGGNTSFGSLIAGAGGSAPDRDAPTACQGGDAGIATGAGGVNGTKGNNGVCGGGNGNGANSPYGTGGVGTSSGTGGSASGFGAGGGGGGNNVGGGSGSPGFITLSYSSEPIAEIVETGGWKKITQAWIKEDNQWKSIQSEVSLVPVPSTSQIVTVNITIASDTNNYVLSDFLSATSYNPGRSIINLTVNANVVVGSTSAGSPAMIIDGLATGDLLNLINNGNIAGAGGRGGAAGSYVSTSVQVSSGKGSTTTLNTTTTSIPGRPGEPGGTALYVTYLTNLINNGTIAGGGGGGGGGGGPTGGQGGGGAGRIVGAGANNGTLTAGGAGTGLGGAGGARGTAGTAGTNSTNAGGQGGGVGPAILGLDNVAITTEGTIIGERKVIAREPG